MMFPQRSGPVVQPESQLQQLVKPFEQSLLRLEQVIRPALPAPQRDAAEGKEEAKPLTLQDMRHMMARYVESLPVYNEQQAAQPAVSSSSSSTSMMGPLIGETSEIGTQTEAKQTRETGTQVQIEQPPQPLVKPAGTEPLVDRVVSLSPPPSGPAQPAVSEKKEEEFPEVAERGQFDPRNESTRFEYIRQMEKEGKITREWLEQFQTSQAGSKALQERYGNLNLYQIFQALGLTRPKLKYKRDYIDTLLTAISERQSQ